MPSAGTLLRYLAIIGDVLTDKSAIISNIVIFLFIAMIKIIIKNDKKWDNNYLIIILLS